MDSKNKFTFNISLSVLNHLGRNLYRNFITVLGEAISNAWDADADNVWIYMDRDKGDLVIKDDGDGMNKSDFQGKFLKIGYSKRKDGITKSKKGRPFIGRKGIGKLALLSCAQKISIISKVMGNDYVGGVIDNSGLDAAIKDDLTPGEYPLENVDLKIFKNLVENHTHGTIIHFENIKEGILNTEEYLKKLLALYFRFSLIDKTFKIHFNGETISLDHLTDLGENTQFLWRINHTSDPFLSEKLSINSKYSKNLKSKFALNGFIASVKEPKHLKIRSTNEKVSVDLFVNGRLREKDLLKHIPSARIVESYLYGQIHFNSLDDKNDRFTSSREGIVSDDPLFKKLLDELKKLMSTVIDDWDKWRIDLRQDGDPENTRLTKKERKSGELFNAISDDFKLPPSSKNKDKVDEWVRELSEDARFNFASYGECFVSENLVRKFIKDKNWALTPEAITEIQKLKTKEDANKNSGNISIEVRHNSDDLSYLSMDHLASLVDKVDPIKDAGLSRDAKEYKPVRDALAHTALLTDLAKKRLNLTYENLKARIRKLLS